MFLLHGNQSLPLSSTMVPYDILKQSIDINIIQKAFFMQIPNIIVLLFTYLGTICLSFCFIAAESIIYIRIAFTVFCYISGNKVINYFFSNLTDNLKNSINLSVTRYFSRVTSKSIKDITVINMVSLFKISEKYVYTYVIHISMILSILVTGLLVNIIKNKFINSDFIKVFFKPIQLNFLLISSNTDLTNSTNNVDNHMKYRIISKFIFLYSIVNFIVIGLILFFKFNNRTLYYPDTKKQYIKSIQEMDTMMLINNEKNFIDLVSKKIKNNRMNHVLKVPQTIHMLIGLSFIGAILLVLKIIITNEEINNPKPISCYLNYILQDTFVVFLIFYAINYIFECYAITEEIQDIIDNLKPITVLNTVSKNIVQLDTNMKIKKIDLHHIEGGYQKDQNLFHTTDLSLHAGKVYLMQSPSGSGKTTFLYSLFNCLPAFFKGNINFQIDNEFYKNLSFIEMEPQMSYISQKPTQSNGSIMSKFKQVNSEITIQEAFEILVKFGISDVIVPGGRNTDLKTKEKYLNQNFIDTLSGGERMRLYISIAMCNPHKSMIIMDESCDAFDPATYNIFLSIFKQIASGESAVIPTFPLSKKIFIIVTHNGINNNIHGLNDIVVDENGEWKISKNERTI